MKNATYVEFILFFGYWDIQWKLHNFLHWVFATDTQLLISSQFLSSYKSWLSRSSFVLLFSPFFSFFFFFFSNFSSFFSFRRATQPSSLEEPCPCTSSPDSHLSSFQAFYWQIYQSNSAFMGLIKKAYKAKKHIILHYIV